MAVALATATAFAVPFAVPADAHSPRDHRPGAPLMDLEVLVPPPLTGKTTGGARDAQVAIDKFGNRVAIAATSLPAAPDSRARAQVRHAPWLWGSFDDGASWEGLELLPRGADALLPAPDAFAIASYGATTYVATATGALTVVTPLTATKRGRLTAGTPLVVPALRTPSSSFSVAAHARGLLVLVQDPTQVSLYDVRATSTTLAAALPTAASCDVAAGTGRVLAVVACLVDGAIQTTSVLTSGDARQIMHLGTADVRGGDSGAPSVDVAPDGSIGVLSGSRLWWVKGSRIAVQDLRTEGGTHRATTLAVSLRGRVAVAAYRLDHGVWNIVTTIFTPGKRPVWSNFAYHDPVVPEGSAAPPSARLSVDTDERGRMQVVWTTSQVHQADLDRPILHNVWSVRSVTS